MVIEFDSLLEAMIDRNRADSEQQFCHDHPDNCNLCAKPLHTERFLIDGNIRGSTLGEWAYMCTDCYSRLGVGVAWGTGQLYERTTDGHWMLVAGQAPINCCYL